MATLVNPAEIKHAKEFTLRTAAFKGDATKVETLLLEGVDPNAIGTSKDPSKPASGKTALHFAVKGSAENTGKPQEETVDYPKVVRLLLSKAADPSIKDKEAGLSVLDYAIQLKQQDIINILKAHLHALIPEKSLLSVSAPELKELADISHRAKVPSKQHLLRCFVSLLEKIKTQDPILSDQTKHYIIYFMKLLISLNPKVEQERLLAENQKLTDVMDQPAIVLENFFKAIQTPLLFLEKFLKTFDIRKITGQETQLPSTVPDTFTLEFCEDALTLIIAECIKFEGQFEKSLQACEATFKKYLEENQTKVGSDFNKTLKRFNNLIKKLREDVQDLIEVIYKRIKNDFEKLLFNPQNFIEFIKIYFPGPSISKIARNTIMIEQKALLETQQIEFCEKEMKLYFEHIKNKLNLFFQASPDVKRYLSYGEKSTAGESVSHTIEKLCIHYSQFIDTLSSQQLEFIRNKHRGSYGSKLKYSPPVFDFFLCGELFLYSCKRCFEKGATVLSQDFQTTAHHLMQELQECLVSRKNEFNETPSFEELKARERKAAKEKEQETRTQAAQQRELTHTQQQEQKIAQEKTAKQNQEKENCLKALLENLKANDPEILLIKNILDGKQASLLKTEFLNLVIKLKIPGTEHLQLNMDNVRDNKVVLKLKEIYSFTAHISHGKDQAKLIDPANIAHLKAMFEAVDLNTGNFWIKVKKYCQSTVPSEPGVVLLSSAPVNANPAPLNKPKNKKNRP